jgi:hypothetical protein
MTYQPNENSAPDLASVQGGANAFGAQGGYFAPPAMFPGSPMYFPAPVAQPEMYWTPAGPMVHVPMQAPMFAQTGGMMFHPASFHMMPGQQMFMVPASPHGPMSGSPIGVNAVAQQAVPSPKPPTDRQQTRTPDDALPAKLELARFHQSTDGAVNQPTMMVSSTNITGADTSFPTLAGSLSQNNNLALTGGGTMHRSPGPPMPAHNNMSVLSHSDSAAQASANDASNSALIASMGALPPPAMTFFHPSASSPTGHQQHPPPRANQPGQQPPRGGHSQPRGGAGGEQHGQLMVCYLDVQVNAQELSSLFSPYGHLNGAKIVYDNNNQSRCFGFVYFCRYEDACNAVQAMDGFRHRGKNLRVHFSQKPNAVFSHR